MFWFVTQPSHTQIEMEGAESSESKWDEMDTEMKAKFHKLLQDKDASLYNEYHWQYLLDFDCLQIWLNSVRMIPYDDSPWTGPMSLKTQILYNGESDSHSTNETMNRTYLRWICKTNSTQ